MKPYLLFLAAMALVSLVAFFAYGIDKRKAKKGRWRTKESILLGLGFFGNGLRYHLYGACLGESAHAYTLAVFNDGGCFFRG